MDISFSDTDLTLLDFWSPTCPPCVALKPEVQKLAKLHHLKVELINVLEKPHLLAQHKVMGLPTLILLQGEVEINRKMEFLPYSSLLEWITLEGYKKTKSSERR